MKRLVGAAAALFLLSSSLLAFQNAFGSPRRFDWPDETSTAFFVSRIAAGQPIAASDTDIVALERRLHPRSVNVINGALVPAGFLGLPLFFGAVGRVLGTTATLFLNPLLAALGGIALFFALRSLVGERHAALSAVLFLFHPATWYFAAYSYLPNVPFLALAIIAAALIAFARSRRRHAALLFAASGVAAGLAFGIRLSEAVWALPLLFLLLAVATKKTKLWIAWCCGVAVAFAPTLVLQQTVFSSLLAGYARFSESGAALPSETVAGPLAYLLPFGVHPLRALARLWDSFLAPFWWYAVPAAIGTALAAYAAWTDPSRQRRRFARSALLIAGLVCGYLVLLYGSWTFADPLTMALNTVGRSYVRYWLPIALAMSIAAAGALARVEGFPELRVRIAGRVVLALMIVASFLIAFVQPQEALLRVGDRISAYRGMSDVADRLVPQDGIMLTQRLDKVFFPERRVLALDGAIGEDVQAMTLVATHAGAYRFYFADALTPDEDAAARAALGKRGIDARLLTYLRPDVPLYELTLRK